MVPTFPPSLVTISESPNSHLCLLCFSSHEAFSHTYLCLCVHLRATALPKQELVAFQKAV